MRCRVSISKTLRPLIEIYLLRVERQFRMQYREPPKMMLPPCGISVCPASRCEPDPAPVQYFGHPFGDVAALVNRTDLAALDDFKVQVFACEDVIALFERLFSSLLHPPVLMFIALRCRNTFRRPDIEYLFVLAILFPVDSDNPSCPSLLCVWTPLPSALAGRGIRLLYQIVIINH